ncbi:proline--tRNA ligase [Helicobacter fennelliae]|uniref:Proline--tRNA ligase n=1 Tax=Helicobacter fennelliae MRY12-0050 TaxID=1325130 RepID=T1DWN0_9HELI|nr:proline--tRNA ligase [Helicobacter fennelliae]GAD19773.1 prolyl-tRNA synthetase [Helicobacter fennelliae MRY12-0050]STP08033.1 prolyl-tRNA synthetase [Helicobacter fennelliae]STQ84058.1 prolyl-tRNA synthetase [Helicobacter fennelliae]
MLFSKTLIPTSKENPKDAVLKSHQFLVRAGYIHQIGSGIYNFLPLGKIVLDKIIEVVKTRMNEANAQHITMGFVIPAELWKNSGRYEKYGKELLRFQDRKNNEFVLGPTHEETITEIIKAFVKSYKQLPLNLYQIHLKFRDELRPRFGLMRGREFIMKDAYSFHSSVEDLDREFELMRQTYIKILQDLELDFRIVDADSGAIGGSGSKEFMVLADCGEDTIVMCEECQYAANIEAANRQKRTPPAPPIMPPKADFALFSTPNVTTIQKLCEFFHIHAYWTIKAVVKKIILDSNKQDFGVFFLRGDDSLEETKALNALNANGMQAIELQEASAQEIEQIGLIPGFIGAYALRSIIGDRPIIFDIDLQDEADLICGANQINHHFVGVDLSTFENLIYADISTINQNDKCAHCGGNLIYKKGIEVGHIFKLGDRYSKALNAEFLDENGKSKPFIMGCYGIGITRLMPAILEQKADEKGCIWGKASTPFLIHIIISNTKDKEQSDFGLWLYNTLQSKNIQVLCDDRDLRFGAKIADFELIGSSYCVVVGKELQSQKIEWINRQNLHKKEFSTHNIIESILRELDNAD